MHIYMSVGRRAANGGPLINPKTQRPTNVVRYRGEVVKGADGAWPSGNDPQSFKRRMEAQGHVVVLSEELIGEQVGNGRREFTLEV